MAATTEDLRVFFFPFLTPGHMIPILDMAVLFARRPGVSVTVITTPGNEPLVRTTIDRSVNINLLLLSFAPEVRDLLPGGKENMAALPFEDSAHLYEATFTLADSLLQLLRRHPLPHCLITDYIYAWSVDVADQLGVPRIVFNGPGATALCVTEALELGAAAIDFDSDSVPSLVFEGLPHRFELTPSQLPENIQYATECEQMQRDSDSRSYGVIVNSFVGIEPEYAELFRRKPGRRAWFVGPVALCHRDNAGRATRGAAANTDGGVPSVVDWLDGRPEGSVLYVCFGSLAQFSVEQLKEISAGLEASGHPFIWVVKGTGGKGSDWVPEESERGFVIKEWAPQVVILNHPAVGGFVTHCGWNSTLEAAAAGVAMVTWPMFYDQYVNERLIVDIMRVGVSARRVMSSGGSVLMGKGELTRGEELAAAVGRVMGGGEEAEGMRRRAREYAAAAMAAMEEGGSSHEDLGRLIEDLRAHKASKAGDA